MSFIDHISLEDRRAFESISTVVHLEPGQYLMRRGDLGGDLFVLEEGTLEVVDQKGDTEHALATLEPGAMVGEVSFLDEAPRSADVRANVPADVRRWAREDVRDLFQHDPALATRIHTGLGLTLARRLRRLTRSTPERVSRATASLHDGQGDPVQDATTAAEAVKEMLLDAEVALRERPYAANSQSDLRTALDRLERDVAHIFVSAPDPDSARRASERLRREMRPWLTRSALASRCMGATTRLTITPDAVHHVLQDVPRGEGNMGAHIDRWLLDRPTIDARRAAERASLELLATSLKGRQSRRVALLDSCAVHRVRALCDALAGRSSDLTFLDPSREVVMQTLSTVGQPHDDVRVHGVQEMSLRYALGHATEPLPAQDILLVYDLLSYVPERIALPLLDWARRRMLRGGHMILWSFDESADEHVLGRVMGWPTIRRSPSRFRSLMARAKLDVIEERSAGTVGRAYLLGRAARPSD